MNKPAKVDEYIASFPADVQPLLEQMRAVVKLNAPNAEEAISYGMPYYRQMGRLVYFAAHTKHIGFYPTGSAIVKFKDELSMFKGAKGSVQFPFDKPLPLDLIGRMVAYRVQENLQKSAITKK